MTDQKIDPKDFALTPEEQEELNALQKPFMDKLAEFTFRNVRKYVEGGGAVNNQLLLHVVDEDLYRFVSPPVVNLVIERIQADEDLCKLNEEHLQAQIDNFRKVMQEELERIKAENPEAAQNPLFQALNGPDPTKMN